MSEPIQNANLDEILQSAPIDHSREFFKTLGFYLNEEDTVTEITHDDFDDAIKEFSSKNNLKYRMVKLENDWWKQDQGVLVGLDKEGNPLIYVPHILYGYKMIDPKNKLNLKINAEMAENLSDQAYMFYPCFPNERISVKQIFLKCLKINKSDIIRLLAFHLILGMLALILPVLSGHIFDYIIPYADSYGLFQVSLILVANILFSSIISLNFFVAATRIKLKADYVVQSAIWDRLLKLPLSFFMLINSGDVANRAGSVDVIQQNLTSTTISSILTGFFSLFSFGFMIYLCPPLSFILFVLIFILAVTNIVASLYQYYRLKKIYAIDGKLYGYLNQLFQNIAKIKVFNSQHAFFQNWLHPFVKSCMGRNVIEKIQIKLDLFRFAIMIFGTMIVYTYAYKTHVFESFGAFIIYNSLYSYFITSFLGLTSAFVKVISLLPLIERVKPILSTKPEDIANGIGLKNIRGKIDLNNIYLRYENPNKYHFIDNSILNAYDSEQYISPWILKNINISIEENDFVAIVGLSGSGKTTLVKILLGLLTPHRGTISIDDYDMQVIDKQSYRKSIGTVLQSSTLFAGSIIENIVGNNTYEMNRIHELAVKIGVDEFINALPMKYETLLAEGGKNISMGQKQKILLMKALINHPKIIMLDEATSALDNQSQRKVFQYLEEIQSTRIIVSHRLSTVKQAHKILIIDKGTIVAAGSYQDIISSSHFKKLMQL